MTETFAQPSDAAAAIAEQAAQLRQKAHQDAHAAAEFGDTNNFGPDMAHQLHIVRDEILVECLSYVLGSDEAAADAYIARWAAANGGDVDTAAVRVQKMPTASQLVQQRAEVKVLDALREAGTEGLSKKELDPLLRQLGWRQEDRWLKEAIAAGTVAERRYGRSTRYVYSSSAPLPADPAAEGAATRR